MWNENIVLLPHDRFIKKTIEPLIPAGLRPNHLTVARMLLTPIVLLFLSRGQFNIGVPLFLFAALTDALDGSLARIRKQITEWGILYDPLADKLLIGSVLFVIVLNHINFLLGVSLLAVEAGMIIYGWIQMRRGKVIQANVWGKIKMAAEVVGIMLLLVAVWLDVDMLVNFSIGTLSVALVAAIVSILSRMK